MIPDQSALFFLVLTLKKMFRASLGSGQIVEKCQPYSQKTDLTPKKLNLLQKTELFMPNLCQKIKFDLKKHCTI